MKEEESEQEPGRECQSMLGNLDPKITSSVGGRSFQSCALRAVLAQTEDEPRNAASGLGSLSKSARIFKAHPAPQTRSKTFHFYVRLYFLRNGHINRMSLTIVQFIYDPLVKC